MTHELSNANDLAMLGADVLSSVWSELRVAFAREAAERPEELIAGLPFPEAVDLVGTLIQQISGGATRVDELVRGLGGGVSSDRGLPLGPLPPEAGDLLKA